MNERPENRRATTAASGPETVSMNVLSAVVLGADEARRRALGAALAGTQAEIVREGPLPTLDLLPAALGRDCDILIIDIEADPEHGLELVEAARVADSGLTVMVYARSSDPELIVRCMRAGAREFLRDPLLPAAVTEALVHAAVRRDEQKRLRKPPGKCLVFAGAKGGAGVTTVASNFAVALANEMKDSVVLVDLDLRLGDVALCLGVSGEFSSLDALANESRMDSDLVSKLLVKHNSGLHILAAPSVHNSFEPTASGVVRLINILRADFPWVIVDAGTAFGEYEASLFEMADKVYLVTQVSVSDLRNAHRFITALFPGEAVRKLEIVLNRYAVRAGEIDEQSIADALTMAPAWKIPSDYATVHWAQNAATALVNKDGPVTRALTAMARAACGAPPVEVRKKRFSLFS